MRGVHLAVAALLFVGGVFAADNKVQYSSKAGTCPDDPEVDVCDGATTASTAGTTTASPAGLNTSSNTTESSGSSTGALDVETSGCFHSRLSSPLALILAGIV